MIGQEGDREVSTSHDAPNYLVARIALAFYDSQVLLLQPELFNPSVTYTLMLTCSGSLMNMWAMCLLDYYWKILDGSIARKYF